MSLYIPFRYLTALQNARLAELAEEGKHKNELQAKAVAELQSYASPEHKMPRASYEVAKIWHSRATAVSLQAEHSPEQIATARRYLASAAEYYKMAGGMPDYQGDFSPAKALEELAALHETGLMVAGRLVGLKTSDIGKGEDFDLEAAFAYRKKAAEQNLFESQCKLAMAYYEGRGCERSERDAYRWFCKARDNSGGQTKRVRAEIDIMIDYVVQDMNNLSTKSKTLRSTPLRLADEEKRKKAFDIREGKLWLQIAQDEKQKSPVDEDALKEAIDMAICKLKPYATPKHNDPDPCFHLGLTHSMKAEKCYFDQAKAPLTRTLQASKHIAKAAFYYRQAIRARGNKLSIFRLAAADALASTYRIYWHYDQKRMWSRSLRLMTFAAKGGYAEAQYNLAETYFYGTAFIKPDLSQARHWLDLALGNETDRLVPEAKKLADKLAKRLALRERLASRPDLQAMPKVISIKAFKARCP